jgi:serine/threonine protein kinase
MVGRGVIPADTPRRLGLVESTETALRLTDTSSGLGYFSNDQRSVVATSSHEIRDESGGVIGIGHLLGARYRLERKLGEGGMGVVYLASDVEVKGEYFAVKILLPDIRTSERSLRLLREEVRKTRSLAHPNIVGVYSLNVDHDDVFVLMEYLEGKTLRELLDQDFGRGMRFDRAWPLIEGVGAGLAYAHDHSIIHSDLKPSNIFVTTSGRPKLLDFGIARAARGPARKLDSAALGALTPAYASCEMLEFLPPDTRDDIYALSCIIYEALSGQHPFGGRDAVAARDASERPAPIQFLTVQQNSTLVNGLAFDRSERTPTVEALLAGLAPGAAPRKRHYEVPWVAWIAVLAVATLLSLSYFATEWFGHAVRSPVSPAAQSGVSNGVSDKSIAVLPFTDMSEKHDQEYFADGLADEVLSLLGTLPELKVISRTSSFQFKGKNTDLRSVGVQLGAAYIVEGSVRRYGDRVRVTAQLVTSGDGIHRWSDSYAESIGDVLRIQQEIATALGRELQVEVNDAPWHATATLVSAEAYTDYLHGLHAMDRFDLAGLETAISFFERALALDPALTRAREKLAQVYYLQLELGLVTPAVSAEHLRQALEGVLRDDPHSAMGHALRAELLETYDWNWTEAQKEAEMAVSLSKNCSLALYAAADISGALGRWSQSEALFRQALAVDPLDADTHQLFGWTLFHSGKYADAEAEARRALEIRPTYSTERFYLAMSLLAQGKLQDALDEVKREPNNVTRQIGLAMVLYALHNNADAARSLMAAEQLAGSDWAYEIAWAHAFRGEPTVAFDWLNRAYDQKDANLEYLKGEWALKSIESDPRYKALLRRMNLPE